MIRCQEAIVKMSRVPRPTNPVIIHENWSRIRYLAPDRFDSYAKPNDRDPLEAVARYLWSLAVSKSLQPTIHVFEVVFRNRIYSALATVRNNPRWFEDARLLIRRDQESVTRAIDELERAKKPVTPGRVVAALTLGFWTGLYGKDYDKSIIRPTIRAAFPYSPAGFKREWVTPDLRDIRWLRNRVAHHEPVAFASNLPAIHAAMHRLIGYMSPELSNFAKHLDDFSAVYGRTHQHHRPDAERMFG